MDPSSLIFSNNDLYTTATSPLTAPAASMNLSRSSTRLRQLLATKSPSSSSITSPNYHNDNKSHTNTFEDLIQVAESPTTTHVSPLPNDLPSPTKRARSHSQSNGLSSNANSAADLLLKQILGRQSHTITTSSTPNLSDLATLENTTTWSSTSSVPTIKNEATIPNDTTPAGLSSNATGTTNKLRSDTFLRVRIRMFIKWFLFRFYFLFSHCSMMKFDHKKLLLKLRLFIIHDISLFNVHQLGRVNY